MLLPDLYYLRNFRYALKWLNDRYSDLLAAAESAFIREFERLPWQSQALLVRLIMRRGPFFRTGKISYPDIGDIEYAAQFLIGLDWIDPRPSLSQRDLLQLITLAEAKAIYPDLPRTCTKTQTMQMLASSLAEPRTFEEWRGDVSESAYFVSILPVCTRLRLLFFGNFSQDWSEFILADLGIFKYETVPLSADSRAFHCRNDIEMFFSLYECRRQLNEDEDVELDDVLAQLPTRIEHDWLESRRAKLMFNIARSYERRGERDSAMKLYLKCQHPGARLRAIRTLEISARHVEAQQLATAAAIAPESDAEAQRLPRILRRLRRHTGAATGAATGAPTGSAARAEVHSAAPPRLDLIVPAPPNGKSVELVASGYIAAPHAPVYYVENALINSLFGLLFWEAIFAPICGAFFHPFHWGPVDLFSPSFAKRRSVLFERGFNRLEDESYRSHIKAAFHVKQGIQSPFVSWRHLTAGLLDIALECIPATHLRRYFTRLLSNLHENRNGFPDLVQFWVAEKRYRMIEVKGPGDRLQDNQLRWMQFCLEHRMPILVCHVRWA